VRRQSFRGILNFEGERAHLLIKIGIFSPSKAFESMSLTPRLIAMLTLPPLLWAGNAVVGRLTVPHVAPMRLNALRWAVVLLVLLVIGWQAIATADRRAEILSRWRHLALVGLLGMGAYNALQYLALTTSTPINVTLIAASMPLWMLLVGALCFAERPRRWQVIGAGLSLLGVMTVLGRGQWATLAAVRFVQGDLYMLAAAASWAGYSWLLARPPASMVGDARPRITEADGRRRSWTWQEFMLVQTLFGMVWAGGAAGVEAVVAPRPIEWSPGVMAAIAYIVIGPSLMAYALWGRAVAAVGPTTAGIFANLTPLFAALLSTTMLGEAPHGYHAAAFALIVAGILVSSRR
jgi:drug/metabolite transporter (DMT)-like permease